MLEPSGPRRTRPAAGCTTCKKASKDTWGAVASDQQRARDAEHGASHQPAGRAEAAGRNPQSAVSRGGGDSRTGRERANY